MVPGKVYEFFPKRSSFFFPFPHLPLFALPARPRGALIMKAKEDRDTRYTLRGRIENKDIV
jgi:hypothetical protein